MNRRSVFLVAALLAATASVTTLRTAPVSAAASTVAAPSSAEVDALDRGTADVSGNGLFVLTNDRTLATPTKRINMATGVVDVLPDGNRQNPQITDDGSLYYFLTIDALVPGDMNGDFDYYTYTFATASYALVPLLNQPANWSFQLRTISGDGRYMGMYGTNGVLADSGVFTYDTIAHTWFQLDTMMPDNAPGTTRQSSDIRYSADGRYAAWLTFPLAGARTEIWVYDRITNTAENATVRSNGAALSDGFGGTDLQISSDGRHVLFTSTSTNIVPGITTVADRVYLRDLDSNSTVLVTDRESPNTQTSPALGGSGQYVVVMEDEPSTVNGNPVDATQPVVYDIVANTRAVLTDPAGPTIPNGYTLGATISANGARVVFDSTVDNFASITPSVPPGELTVRVFQTPLRPPLPARLLDTRPTGATDDGLFQKGGLLPANNVLQLTVGGRLTIPADAEAVVLNITSVTSSGNGWVTAWPCGLQQPDASTLNMVVGRAVANMSITALGTDGKVCLFNSQPTHLIVDASYVFPSGSPLTPLDPKRMLDTRPTGVTFDHQSEKGGQVSAGGVVTLPLGGRGTIPADALGVVLNITAAGPQANGYLKAYACNVSPPNASVANYVQFVTKASQTIVSLSPAGTVCISTSQATNIIADAVGYFDASSNYTPLTPARLLETRSGPGLTTIDHLFEGQGARPAGSTLQLTVANRGGAPVGESTVVLDIVAVAASSGGYVTAYSCGTTPPTVSSLNMIAGGTANNHVVVTTGAGGAVCLFTSVATHLLVDVVGVLPAAPVVM